MTTTTQPARSVRLVLTLLAFLMPIAGTLAFSTATADAQYGDTLVIGRQVTDSHSATCIRSGNESAMRISSSFTGPSGQYAVYRYRFWKQNSNGTWSRVYEGEKWRAAQIPSSGTVMPSKQFTVPTDTVWWVSVESFRWTNGVWSHHRDTPASLQTQHYGRLTGSICKT